MPSRRGYLTRLAAIIASASGLTFGSGAFTQVTANRTFGLSLAADDTESQLVIEGTELASAGISQTAAGTFSIDSGDIPLNAITTFGRFTDNTDATTLTNSVFVVRNENQTEEDVDITVGLDADSSLDVVVKLAIVDPSDRSVSVTSLTGENAGDVTIPDVPSAVSAATTNSAAEIECGLIVDTTSQTTAVELDLTFSITAVRSATTS